MANARASEAVRAAVVPIELQTVGFIQSFSIEKAKPGRVVVKVELLREEGLVERLAALADRQLAVGVMLRQLQAEMPVDHSYSPDGKAPPGE